MNNKLKLVDTTKRSILIEGRSYGTSFAFAKRKGNELHAVGALSPCREYLHDQLGAEYTGKVVSKWGYVGKKANLFDDEMGYILFAVLPYHDGTHYGKKQDAETAHLAAHYDKIQAFLNYFEEQLKVPDRTSIVKLEENRYVCIMPKYWMKTSWLTSLYSLMIRAAVEGLYVDGNPYAFFKASNQSDAAYVKVAVPKLDKLLAGAEIKPQENITSWHEQGIVDGCTL